MSERGSLFARIRSRCHEVTLRAQHVAIDAAGLDAFAERLAASPFPEDDLDPAHDYTGGDDAMLAFVFALDAINFGSGWFPVLRKRAGLSGYRTIATACKERFEAEGQVSGDDLRKANASFMARLLDQDLEDPEVAELMGLFARAWRDLGVWLQRDYDDRFANVVAAAGGSGERLVESLARMPLYQDVARYEELEVPLYKRAQITVADLHRVFGGKGFGAFEDLDALTLFADNLVPHVLRCEGVLTYAQPLADRIDAEERLEAGSTVETEIRAVAVEAVERLVARLQDRGRSVSAHRLDALLWNAGQAPAIKARPRHRARSTFY